MNHPTAATRYTWQSAPLADGQECRFVVRIATAPWPSGLETQNTDERTATGHSSIPAAPVLAAHVI